MELREIVSTSVESATAIFSLLVWLFLAFQKNRTKIDKDIQILLLLSVFLLINDIIAMIFSGMVSNQAYFLTRLSNFLVFTCLYTITMAFGKYLYDYLRPKNKFELTLYKVITYSGLISILVVIISQFTNWYYYFDEYNLYHRASLWIFSQVQAVVVLPIYTIILYRNKTKIAKNELNAVVTYIALPLVCTILQTAIYGFPFQNLAIVISSWVLFLAREIDVRNQLEEAMNAKDEFLSKMSHDLRTPLNGILGLIEINDSHPEDVELLKNNRRRMKVAASHLLSLLNDVLELSKLERRSINFIDSRFNMEAVLDDVITISKLKADENNIKLVCDSSVNNLPYPYVYGSPLHIKQILINIIDNAIKYNKENGSVSIKIGTAKKEDKVQYSFIISDTGIGMSPEYIEHIFEPFTQENSDDRSIYKGAGLGMSIVGNLVNAMKGSIKIDSKVNQGSTFTIDLPFRIAQEETVKKENKSVDISGKRILLVEDNNLNRDIARMLLSEKGVIVFEAKDGKEAVDLFKESEAHSFDLILMDVMMPIMDGLAATREIRNLDREDSKNIPIIALTANAFSEDIKKTKEAGMNDHLSKPFEINKLVDLINKYC